MSADTAPHAERLRERLAAKSAQVGVLGMGYVGLPLAMEFAKAGFHVHGIDVDATKVDRLRRGESYITDVPDDTIAAQVTAGRFSPTTDYGIISTLDVVIICVPTPLRKTKDPDISYIVSARDAIRRHLQPGQLIILESTTYPGTTEEVILPPLAEQDREVGRDFFLVFSPERVDPGNARFTTANTPKVLGGVTPTCTKLGTQLYDHIVTQTVPVSSTRAAEMVKLLENTFRIVNIGLVNELTIMCNRLGIDVWEVIDAAATKPFGFMPFYPGPGLGGHCIPIDPLYLSWKMRSLDYTARFIELASDVNRAMPEYVVAKVNEGLNARQKSIRGARILILGLTYKKDINDVRESPALDVIDQLRERGADLAYHDPYVPAWEDGDLKLTCAELTEATLQSMDCVAILTDHSAYDYPWIVRHADVVVDTRNATQGIETEREKIFRL